MPLTLTSSAFRDGESIPEEYTADGAGDSPPLAWSDVPEQTRSFVLVMHDPDAPSGDYTHWVVLDIPAAVREFPAGAAPIQRGQEGLNSAGLVGYHPPSPPHGHGPHRYLFELYALDTPHIGPGEGASREAVEAKARDHLLGTATLTCRYQRR